MKKIKISAISYLNTLPLLYGLQQSQIIKEHTFTLDYPSESAQKLINKQVDIGLIPVGALPLLKDVSIISDYCIGAIGKVDSVLLVSEVPLEDIETIVLDYQSRSSVNLVRVLAKNFWNIFPKWRKASEGYEKNISGTTAGVIIGDRTFELPKKFQYQYDLAEEWQKYTNLPFVFAVWVSNIPLSKDFISEFNESLRFGITHIDQVIKQYEHQIPYNQVDIHNYLKHSISYILDDQKRLGMERFLNELKQLTPYEQLFEEQSSKKSE